MCAGKVDALARHDRPPVVEQGVVVDDEGSVGGAPDVELDGAGAGGDGGGERLHGVLAGEPRRPRWAITSTTA